MLLLPCCLVIGPFPFVARCFVSSLRAVVLMSAFVCVLFHGEGDVPAREAALTTVGVYLTPWMKNDNEVRFLEGWCCSFVSVGGQG